MKVQRRFSKTGWFGLCPVLLEDHGDAEPMDVVERFWWLTWWFMFNEVIIVGMASLMAFVGAPVQAFRFWGVRDLDKPRWLIHDIPDGDVE